MILRAAGAVLGLLLMTRSAMPGAVPSDAYIWQRRWTPGVASAVAANAALFGTWHVLAAEIGDAGQVVTTGADWTAATHDQHRVVPVIRIEGTIDAARAATLVPAILAIRAALPAAVRGRIEIDHDSPTARLAAYGAFLCSLRAAMPDASLAATALPTWLSASDFDAVADAVDLLILQVHSIDDPRTGVFDPARAARWTAALARRTRRPFLVALPAYGARVVGRPGGPVLAVAAEASVLDGAPGQEIAAAPQAVAAFLDHLRRDQPDGLRGVVWFRLPVAEDRRAWSIGTLRAVATGQVPHPSVAIQTRPGWTAGLRDIVVVNTGDTDAALPPVVSLPPGCAAADGVGVYRRDGEALRQEGRGLLPAHATVLAGWMRCPEAGGERHAAE